MDNQLLAYLKLQRPIPPADGDIITGYFKTRYYKEGDYLFEGGKVCRELFFVCNGVIRITSTNEKGVELTHVFYKENNFCTLLQSFNDETAVDAAIQASCDAGVLVITKSKLLDLYRQLPYMKEIIDRLNQQHLIDKVNTRNIYLGGDAESNYKLFITQNPAIALRVPLNHIAGYLGITPQSLSRIRKNIR